MVQGPAPALALLAPLLDSGDLADYRLAHLAEAELLRQLDRPADAARAYARALRLSSPAERPAVEARLNSLPPVSP
jgi:RNA polymerase sigma-70 factor (ECF subfamily)